MAMMCHDPNYSSCLGPSLIYQQSCVSFSKTWVYLTWNFFVCKTKPKTPVLYLSVLNYKCCCYTMRKICISQF